MVISNLKPHVPPEASPEVIIRLLREITSSGQSFPTVKALRQYSETIGLNARPEIPVFMSNIGLLETDTNGTIHTSLKGQTLIKMEERALADILHFLIYTRWSAPKPHQCSDSWGYRQVSDIFWKRAPIDAISITDYVTEEVRNEALIQFGEDVSFSPKSIRGVRKWLGALSPPVMEGTWIERRHFVHPQLLVLAIAWVVHKSEGEIGIDLLLTPDRREAICKLCLLDPSALDQTLDWMLPVYPHIVGPGTTAGVYGRFIQFHKWPTLSDLTSTT